MSNIEQNQEKAKEILKVVEKHLENIEGASVMSFGVKLATSEQCSNHVWIRVNLGDS